MATRLGVILLCTLLAACASLRPGFEEPVVSVSSFRALPSDAAVPRFEVGLHIVNPNGFPLKLRGLSYSVSLEGHHILTGATNQLPQISAYGEGDVLLQVSPDLINTISLFADLLNQPRESFSYQLSAKLDIGALLPKIIIERTGKVSLQGLK